MVLNIPKTDDAPKSPRTRRKQKTAGRVRNNTLTSLCLISHHPFFSKFRECLFVLRRLIEACNERSCSERIGGSRASIRSSGDLLVTSLKDCPHTVLTDTMYTNCSPPYPLQLVSDIPLHWESPESHQCLTSVSPVSHQCLTGVSPVSHRCLTGVSPESHQSLTRVSQSLTESHQSLTRVSPESHQSLTRVSPESHQSLTRVSPESHQSPDLDAPCRHYTLCLWVWA